MQEVEVVAREGGVGCAVAGEVGGLGGAAGIGEGGVGAEEVDFIPVGDAVAVGVEFGDLDAEEAIAGGRAEGLGEFVAGSNGGTWGEGPGVGD